MCPDTFQDFRSDNFKLSCLHGGAVLQEWMVNQLKYFKMRTKEEILIKYGVTITHDGNDYMKYGCTLNKIKLAMQEYASEQCQKRDELLSAYAELEKCLDRLPISLYGVTRKHKKTARLREKIEQLKKQIQ